MQHIQTSLHYCIHTYLNRAQTNIQHIHIHIYWSIYINACFPNLHIYLIYTLKSIHLNHIHHHTLYSYSQVHIPIKIFFHTIPMHTQTSNISIFTFSHIHSNFYTYLIHSPHPYTSPIHTDGHKLINIHNFQYLP